MSLLVRESARDREDMFTERVVDLLGRLPKENRDADGLACLLMDEGATLRSQAEQLREQISKRDMDIAELMA